MKNYNKNSGISIIGLIFLSVIIILVLGYYNISVKSVVNSPVAQENVNYVGGGVKSFWTTYLAEPAAYLWNDVWIKIFWKGFISNMERIRDNQPTDLDKAAGNLQVKQN